MCRRKQVQGISLLCFGLGIMVGYFLESWFLCSVGGVCLIFLGMMLVRQK